MQTQRRAWRSCQQYNVVNFVASVCLVIIAVCGLASSGIVARADVEGVYAKTSTHCSMVNQTHIVVEGDTLAYIAASHGVDEQILAVHNSISSSHALYAGQNAGQSICMQQSIRSSDAVGNAFSSNLRSLRAQARASARMRLVKPGRHVETRRRDRPTGLILLHIDRVNNVWPHVSDGYAFRNLLTASSGFVNVFSYGQCTWWAAQRYFQLHNVGIPWKSGANAWQWIMRAYESRWRVSRTATVGSILVLQAGVQGAGSAGHVGIVEQVLNDGTIIASSMNWGYHSSNISFDAFRPGPGVVFVGLY